MAKQESFKIRWRGIVSGPHDLDQLRAMLGRGEISLMHEALMDGHWVSLEELIQQKEKSPAAAKPTVAEQEPAPKRPDEGRFIAGAPAGIFPQRPAGPPPLPAEELFHVAKGGQQQGPYTKSVIRQLVAGGVLSSDDLAWKEGMPEWMQINRLMPDLPRPTFLPQHPPPMSPPFGMRPAHSEAPQNSADDQVRFGPVMRDVAIIWVLSAAGGLIVGIATGGPEEDPGRFGLAVAASNVVALLIGFTIAGCLAPRQRWTHLRWVALGSWLLGALNIVLGFSTVSQWAYSIVFIALIMGLGGVLSYAFKPASKD